MCLRSSKAESTVRTWKGQGRSETMKRKEDMSLFGQEGTNATAGGVLSNVREPAVSCSLLIGEEVVGVLGMVKSGESIIHQEGNKACSR